MNVLAARFLSTPPGGLDPAEALRIEPGARADYLALAGYHYRAARPGTFAAVLRAVAPDGTLAGVLVASHPTLEGPWRHAAWPGRYRTAQLGPRRVARRLNRELRVISRVVVDPRWRGMGVARRLVEAYLLRPQTPRTEAVAAMAAACPFFAAAGMAAHPLPFRRGDERLLRSLRAAGRTPWSLLRARPPARLAAALRAWARSSRTTRRFARAPLADLARLAATRLTAPPIAFTWPPPPPARSCGPSPPQGDHPCPTSRSSDPLPPPICASSSRGTSTCGSRLARPASRRSTTSATRSSRAGARGARSR